MLNAACIFCTQTFLCNVVVCKNVGAVYCKLDKARDFAGCSISVVLDTLQQQHVFNIMHILSCQCAVLYLRYGA